MIYVLIGIICVLCFFLGKKSAVEKKEKECDDMIKIAKENNSKSLKELTEKVKKKSSTAIILLILCSPLAACTTREFSSIYTSWYTPYTQEELLRIAELGLADVSWETFAQKTLANQLTFDDLTK
jgi:hypothetical protein